MQEERVSLGLMSDDRNEVEKGNFASWLNATRLGRAAINHTYYSPF